MLFIDTKIDNSRADPENSMKYMSDVLRCNLASVQDHVNRIRLVRRLSQASSVSSNAANKIERNNINRTNFLTAQTSASPIKGTIDPRDTKLIQAVS